MAWQVLQQKELLQQVSLSSLLHHHLSCQQSPLYQHILLSIYAENMKGRAMNFCTSSTHSSFTNCQVRAKPGKESYLIGLFYAISESLQGNRLIQKHAQ